MPNKVLEIKNLAKFFDDKKVLRDISLEVFEGDVIAVVGYSGSGKSTFLRCINLLEEPDRGELVFNGETYFFVTKCCEDFINLDEYQKDISDFNTKKELVNERLDLLISNKKSGLISDEELIELRKTKKENKALLKGQPLPQMYFRKKDYEAYIKQHKPILANENKLDTIRSKMVMVFQNFNLFNNMDVLNNCMFPLIHVKGMKKEEAKKIALEKLELVNMSTHLTARPKTLSGGQKQRVAIARSLCMDPSIILFDEPTSALDPQMVNEVLDVMKKLASKGMTMIVVTHEMNFAKNVANKVMYMDDGYVVEYTSSNEFFSNPKHSKTRKFLSLPE